MKLDLWVRLNITMADDNKVSGWTQIYGKHELAMYKKPFKSLKPIVNDHIEKINWLTICNRWGETNKVIEVNTSKIKKYVIKECVQPCEEEEWGLVRKWYREHSRKEREARLEKASKYTRYCIQCGKKFYTNDTRKAICGDWECEEKQRFELRRASCRKGKQK